MKSLSILEVTHEWLCYRRALGFSVLVKKLQQVLGSGRGYMYNAPSYMFIYADGSCIPKFDTINKINSGISLINSCRVTGSHETHKQLCNLLHNERTSNVVFVPPDFSRSMMDPDDLTYGIQPQQKRPITFRKESILLFAFRKESILLFAFRKRKHLTVCF